MCLVGVVVDVETSGTSSIFRATMTAIRRSRPWVVGGEIHRLLPGRCPRPGTVWLMTHGNACRPGEPQGLCHWAMFPRLIRSMSWNIPDTELRGGSPVEGLVQRRRRRCVLGLSGARFRKSTPVGVIGESIGSGPASSLALGKLRRPGQDRPGRALRDTFARRRRGPHALPCPSGPSSRRQVGTT